MMAEIFVSFLVLFAVVGLGVYTADNWRWPRGFSIENVWDVSIDMKQTTDDTFNQTQQQTVAQVQLALKNMPEIITSGGAMLAPYQMGSSNSRYGWRGRSVDFGVAEVTDGFKDVLGLQIVEGRWFGRADDGLSYQPVVINEEMRRELFDDGPALGQVLNPEHRPEETDYREQRIVGVIEAYREDGEFDGTRNYVIYRKDLDVFDAADRRNRPPRNMLIKVRQGTTAELQEQSSGCRRRAVLVVRGDAAPTCGAAPSSSRFVPLVGVGLVAAFLMLMVALGLLGVLWQSVTQRTREIGLRRAKGAQPGKRPASDSRRDCGHGDPGADRRRARRDSVPAARRHLLRRAARLRDQPCDIGDRHLSSDVGVRLVPEPDGDDGRPAEALRYE